MIGVLRSSARMERACMHGAVGESRTADYRRPGGCMAEHQGRIRALRSEAFAWNAKHAVDPIAGRTAMNDTTLADTFKEASLAGARAAPGL